MAQGDWATGSKIRIQRMYNVPDATTMAVSYTDVEYSVVLPSGQTVLRQYRWVPVGAALTAIQSAAASMIGDLTALEGIPLEPHG